MLADFFAYLHTTDRSPHTIRAYQSDLRTFARWFEQTNGQVLEPHLVTRMDLREYRQHLLRVERLAASTINRRLQAIRTYLRWAQERGLREGVPEVREIRQQAQAPRWLSKTEEAALRRAAERAVQSAALRSEQGRRWAVRNRALLLFLLNTGLRAEEACALQLNDLELGERKGRVCVQRGKGRKQRRVPLNAEARRALAAWLTVRPEVEHQWVFVGQRGNPITPSALRRIVSSLAYQARVDATPHTLRHTFAKRLVDAGVSLEQVAALLGHANLNTTRTYLTPGAQDLARAVEHLDK